MGIVTGSPARLHRYADALLPADARLRDEVPALRATLWRYRDTNPDFGADHTRLADELDALLDDAMALAGEVRLLAAAFETLDTAGRTGLRRGSQRQVDEARDRITGSWDHVDSLLDLVVDLPEGEWRALVLGGWRCAPGAGDYGGSGGIRGPDGRVYPLVIPELEIDGQTAHVAYGAPTDRDPGSLGGADGGWRVTDERVGVARVEDRPTRFAQGVVVAAMATGLQGPAHRTAGPEELQAVGFTRDGRPVLGERPAGPPRDPRPSHTDDGPARPQPWLGHRSSPARVVGALDLVVGAFDGARVASELGNAGSNLYRVLFEEHEDGVRRRARLHTYQVLTTPEASSFVPFMGYGVEGQLRRRQVNPVPQHRQVLSHGQGAGGGGAGTRAGHRTAGRRRDARR